MKKKKNKRILLGVGCRTTEGCYGCATKRREGVGFSKGNLVTSGWLLGADSNLLGAGIKSRKSGMLIQSFFFFFNPKKILWGEIRKKEMVRKIK